MAAPTNPNSSSGQTLHVDFKKSRPDQATRKKIKKYLQEANELHDLGESAQALYVIANALKLNEGNRDAERLFHFVFQAMEQKAAEKKKQ